METRNWSQLIDSILLRKVPFVMTFFVVFLATYSFLYWVDFLPELVNEPEIQKVQPKQDSAGQMKDLNSPSATEVLTTITTTTLPEMPIEPVFPLTLEMEALDKTITVVNPTSRSIADLDTALLDGAVRHPDSATLEQSGTVFILAHSSYLPVVRNKNFQAFNGIQNLKWGDLIILTAKEGKFVYRVDKVYRAKAEDVTVPIAGPNKRLVLATCNSFGSTADRYIVEADFVEQVSSK